MKQKKYSYKAYGINISSQIKLPELLSKEAKNFQVFIEYGRVENPVPERGKYFSKVEKTKDGFKCYINCIGGVKIVGKRKIIVSPENKAEKRGFRFLVSGIALGLLLHLRGLVTLHASAVAIRGGAVAFVGQKGMGKSTMAAALHASGHSIVTDDLLVLNTTEDSVQAYPGFPHLKLTAESIIESLDEDPHRIPKIDPEGPKHSFAAKKDFLRTPLPLQCVYVLEYGQETRRSDRFTLPHSKPIGGKEAIIELVRNSYVARLFPEEAISEQHLTWSTEIAGSVPLRRLHRKKSLGDIPDLVSLIEEEQGANK
jgi:hypothetical protein